MTVYLRRSLLVVANAIIIPCPPRAAFPPPWIVEEHNDACFIVNDAAGRALVRRMAPNFAKLPELLRDSKVAP
jgi:hypothetical protein